jgi:hypothetical protein
MASADSAGGLRSYGAERVHCAQCIAKALDSALNLVLHQSAMNTNVGMDPSRVLPVFVDLHQICLVYTVFVAS